MLRGLPSSFAALRWPRRCCCRSACSRGRQPAPPGNCWRASAFERIRMLVGDRAHLGRLFGSVAAQASGQAAVGQVQAGVQ